MVRVTEDTFGTVRDPFTNNLVTIRRFTIDNDNNISVQIITYGATITSLLLPDSEGKVDDIALGFDDVEGYQEKDLSKNPYICCTVGRVCSRIGNASYVYKGQRVNVSKNFLGKHYLHGGNLGFGQCIWDVLCIRPNGVVLQFISPDGHEGFPGEVTANVTFTLDDENQFRQCYEATTTKPTPVNMTNHGYYNLAGHATGKKGMFEHIVQIKAQTFTDKDEDTVPTGEILPLRSTDIDLRRPVNIGVGIKRLYPKGYDDNYVLALENNTITLQAKITHPPTGRFLEVSSNQPGMHFYTAHNMPDIENGERPLIKGKDGVNYEKYSSFCMETQQYPDAVNHSNFPSIILQPGEVYRHVCIFKFSICSIKDETIKPDED
ncbi:galactose mutarotase-like [Teleopsis dalmanni]|uniref:galactose mutarotase-like n=1 Tax=Teleopsis dalmanni TaxID=139649 RepID=UPI000D32BD4A|nr:galactose mutarotase-like [Teleopsis dalmanni]